MLVKRTLRAWNTQRTQPMNNPQARTKVTPLVIHGTYNWTTANEGANVGANLKSSHLDPCDRKVQDQVLLLRLTRPIGGRGG